MKFTAIHGVNWTTGVQIGEGGENKKTYDITTNIKPQTTSHEKTKMTRGSHRNFTFVSMAYV